MKLLLPCQLDGDGSQSQWATHRFVRSLHIMQKEWSALVKALSAPYDHGSIEKVMLNITHYDNGLMLGGF